MTDRRTNRSRYSHRAGGTPVVDGAPHHWLRTTLVLVLLALGGCAGMPRYADHAVYQRGQASYYAARFAGRTTASGERFDPTRYTAAHRKLPFGTRVKVTDLNNGRSVIVRINDRGPYTPGRIIDLSPAAASALDMRAAGVAPVTLTLVR